MKKIAIAADHAGYEYKEFAKKQLEGKYELVDFGTHGLDFCRLSSILYILLQVL